MINNSARFNQGADILYMLLDLTIGNVMLLVCYVMSLTFIQKH